VSKVHQSTREEIEAAREHTKAAHCSGDGVNTYDLNSSHDWRLWKRAPSSRIGEDPKVAQEFGWRQTWYCTHCRKFEDLFVVVEGARFSSDVSEYAEDS
jgi:hypothetical protein